MPGAVRRGLPLHEVNAPILTRVLRRERAARVLVVGRALPTREGDVAVLLMDLESPRALVGVAGEVVVLVERDVVLDEGAHVGVARRARTTARAVLRDERVVAAVVRGR